jgi:hypothetical protein
MADSNTDFTYLSILRELEKEVAEVSGTYAPEAGAELTRSNVWFKDTVGGLLSFATDKIAKGGKNIAKKLYVKEEAIKKAEGARLRNLSGWTQKQMRYEFGRAATWPPLIPIGLTVERFIGTTIGLHSEFPEEPFERHIESSLSDAVAPAIAWGLWCQLQEVPHEVRRQASDSINASIVNQTNQSPDVARLVLTRDPQASAEIPYLRLLHGWINILKQRQAEWAISPEALRTFRTKILEQFESFSKEPGSALSDLLLRHYGVTDQGMDRERIVAMVQRRSPNSAAFLRGRLSLLSGAHLPGLESFRHLVRTSVGAALDEAEAFLEADMSRKDETAADSSYGELACGRAYWLARLTYGKHSSEGILEPRASTLTLRLLLRAASYFKNDDDNRAYCLRFAAGYATNPRYLRSDYVLKRQLEVARDYEREPLHRPRLVDMFYARIAWQCQASGKGLKNKRDAEKAARLYNRALDGAFGSSKGLDSEAPIHLFPELYVFLDTFDDNSAGSRKVLSVIDHVVQHNFGVYFDAPTEEKLIKAGIRQFQEWHEAIDGDISPEDALRGLAPSKGDGDYRLHGILEGKIKKANAGKAKNEEEEPEV